MARDGREEVKNRSVPFPPKNRSVPFPRKEIEEIECVENTPESFLALAKEVRHYVTHRGGLPMAHYFNGPSNLVHPVSRKEFEVDSVELQRSWGNQLEQLLNSLRSWPNNSTS